MKWLNTLERKYARFAIPHLSIYIVAGQLLLWAAASSNPVLYQQMPFEITRVLKGEVWRVVTFIFVPPHSNWLWLFFALYIFWLMSRAVESYWGAFRYNLYLLVGLTLSLLVACAFPNQPATSYWVLLSMLLAFSALYPDYEFRLYFILPVKVKYLAWIQWAYMSLASIQAARGGAWLEVCLIAISALNYVLFFGPMIVQRLKTQKRTVAKKVEQAKQAREDREPFHKCSACDKTDVSDPTMLFRYKKTDEGTLCFCEACMPKE